MHIVVLLGTARSGRVSEQVRDAFVASVPDIPGVTFESLDVKDFPLPHTIAAEEDHPVATVWRSKAKTADGFIIVSPEYNHGYPGELKILLDSAYEEYEGKPVAVVSVSSGGFGGVRMVEHLRASFIKMGMLPIRTMIPVSNVDAFLDEKGAPRDPLFSSKVKGLVEDLVSYASALSKRAKRAQ